MKTEDEIRDEVIDCLAMWDAMSDRERKPYDDYIDYINFAMCLELGGDEE